MASLLLLLPILLLLPQPCSAHRCPSAWRPVLHPCSCFTSVFLGPHSPAGRFTHPRPRCRPRCRHRHRRRRRRPRAVWAVYKHFVDKRTREKVSVHGTNFLPALQKHLSVPQPRRHFGPILASFPLVSWLLLTSFPLVSWLLRSPLCLGYFSLRSPLCLGYFVPLCITRGGSRLIGC